MLGRIVQLMARVSPRRHRDLVRGMLAELDSISDPSERARFEIGAIAALVRLSLSGYGRATVHGPGRLVDLGESRAEPSPGVSSISTLTTRQLLLRHAIPFAVSLVSLTVVELARRWDPQLSARAASGGTVAEVLVLAMPSALALTIPMAVFLSVSWVFTRLGTEGLLTAARRDRRAMRRLIVPVLGASAVVAAMTLVSNAEVLPRANARLVAVLEGAPREPTARTMNFGELLDAARAARAADGAEGVAHPALYQIEIQKKLAVAAACMFLALAAAAISIRFPRGGRKLVLAAGNLVFMGYFLLLIAGEVLADEQLLSPLVAMWMANALLLAVALLLFRRPGRAGPTRGAETLAIDG